MAASKEFDSSVAAGDGFFTVVAAVVRAHPKISWWFTKNGL